MEERAGVGLPTGPDGPDRPQMDPPNVLWFAGTYAIAVAVYVLLGSLPGSHRGVWLFLVAIGFLLAFAAESHYLLRRSWWVPGGLAAALAVAMVPAVSVQFLKLIGVWPHNFGNPFTHFSGWTLAVAVVTALAGLLAFALTRFSFIFAVVVGAILVSAGILSSAPSQAAATDRAKAALFAGAALVVVGVFLDAFGRRRDAFWFHALGWLSVAGGLVFFTVDPGGDPERGWVPMLIVGILMLIIAGPIGRATWAVYGVLGYYAPIVHYLAAALNENRWPFALLLLALGASIFVLGMLLYRYGKSWSQRFVRRPPPDVAVPP